MIVIMKIRDRKYIHCTNCQVRAGGMDHPQVFPLETGVLSRLSPRVLFLEFFRMFTAERHLLALLVIASVIFYV